MLLRVPNHSAWPGGVVLLPTLQMGKQAQRLGQSHKARTSHSQVGVALVTGRGWRGSWVGAPPTEEGWRGFYSSSVQKEAPGALERNGEGNGEHISLGR